MRMKLQNLFPVNPWRYVIVFLFGLIHGMGFAKALTEAGLPETVFILH